MVLQRRRFAIEFSRYVPIIRTPYHTRTSQNELAYHSAMIARLSGQVELQMAYWRDCVRRSDPEECEWEDFTSRAEGTCKEFRASWRSSCKIVVPSPPVRPCSSFLSTVGISTLRRTLLSPLGQGVTSIACAMGIRQRRWTRQIPYTLERYIEISSSLPSIAAASLRWHILAHIPYPCTVLRFPRLCKWEVYSPSLIGCGKYLR